MGREEKGKKGKQSEKEMGRRYGRGGEEERRGDDWGNNNDNRELLYFACRVLAFNLRRRFRFKFFFSYEFHARPITPLRGLRRKRLDALVQWKSEMTL